MNATALDSNRRIDLAGHTLPAAPRPSPKTINIEIGDTVYRFPYWVKSWTKKAWRDRNGRLHAPRRYERYVARFGKFMIGRSRFADLKTIAKERATAEANHQTARLELTAAQQSEYVRSQEEAGKVGVPVLLLVQEAVEARLKASRAKIVRKTCPEVVDELVAHKEKNLRRKRWLRSALKPMLERLAEFYSGPIDALLPCLNDWVASLSGGPVYRKHHRDAAAQLLRYAHGRGYLSLTQEELERQLLLVDSPQIPNVKIRAWPPEYVVKLLASTHENMIPFTVLQVFASIRHEELNPQQFDLAKRPLDWEDVDWDRKEIHVKEETAKTGEDRIVPMPDNLVEWLRSYRKASGSICRVSNTSNCLSRAKHRAGLPGGRGDSRNILRKTCISARVAITKNRGQVAEESGTSIAKMKSNYKSPMSEAQAKRLFAIYPTNADILQIPLRLK